MDPTTSQNQNNSTASPASPASGNAANATNAAAPTIDIATTGVIIVDHGSRRAESNDMLLEVVRRYCTETRYVIVEPAHMEIAEPSIGTAFSKCVARGATHVVIMPYFLLPGKHWDKDIPHLAQQAAAKHPGISHLVTAPLGLSPLMNKLIDARIDYCLEHIAGKQPECDVCKGLDRCTMK